MSDSSTSRLSRNRRRKSQVSFKNITNSLDLREVMRSKNTEARKVKALSQVILDQRSDVEQFFLEALEQIKEEIRKKIAIERK